MTNLSSIPTAALVAELRHRAGVITYEIEKGQQFSFDIAYRTVDYTNHMPKTLLLEIDYIEAGLE